MRWESILGSALSLLLFILGWWVQRLYKSLDENRQRLEQERAQWESRQQDVRLLLAAEREKLHAFCLHVSENYATKLELQEKARKWENWMERMEQKLADGLEPHLR